MSRTAAEGWWTTAATAELTTYRRDGSGVSTPVSIAARDGGVYFVTARDSGKAKRLRRNGRVSLAPRDSAGHEAGRPVHGHAVPASPVSGWTRARRLRGLGYSVSGSYLWYSLRGVAMEFYRVVLDEPSPLAADGTRHACGGARTRRQPISGPSRS